MRYTQNRFTTSLFELAVLDYGTQKGVSTLSIKKELVWILAELLIGVY